MVFLEPHREFGLEPQLTTARVAHHLLETPCVAAVGEQLAMSSIQGVSFIVISLAQLLIVSPRVDLISPSFQRIRSVTGCTHGEASVTTSGSRSVLDPLIDWAVSNRESLQ